MSKTRDSACAKIWDFIYKHYEEYGTNIMDICARDTMSDYKGLTVIIPNVEFMESFHNKIHSEDGSIREAKNMLRNTIIKRCLNTPDDFDSREYYNTLPIASGIVLPLSKVEKEHVILDNNVKIKNPAYYYQKRGENTHSHATNKRATNENSTYSKKTPTE